MAGKDYTVRSRDANYTAQMNIHSAALKEYRLLGDSEQFISPDVVVNFRPKVSWDGRGYGFDWFRIGDLGEIPFERIIGKYYKDPDFVNLVLRERRRSPRVVPQLSLLPTFLVNDGKPLNEGDLLLLKKDYNYMFRLNRENEKQEEYYVPWLSLFPDTTATLRLKIFARSTPDYLEFEANDNFLIEPMRVSEMTDTIVNITCKKEFSTDQELILRNYKKNSEGTVFSSISGKLNVWRNSKVITKKIVLIRTKLYEEEVYKPIRGEEDAIKYILKQAMVSADIKYQDLDLTTGWKNRNALVVGNTPGNTKMKASSKSGGNPELALNREMQIEMNRRYPGFEQFLQVFLFNYSVQTADSSNSKLKAGVYHHSTNNIVAYKDRNATTLAHEVLHGMGLSHTFENIEYSQTALFTYDRETTDNIMDYSASTYTTYHWQWQLLHSLNR